MKSKEIEIIEGNQNTVKFRIRPPACITAHPELPPKLNLWTWNYSPYPKYRPGHDKFPLFEIFEQAKGRISYALQLKRFNNVFDTVISREISILVGSWMWQLTFCKHKRWDDSKNFFLLQSIENFILIK